MVSICRPVAPPLASKSQSPRGNFQIPREERKNPQGGTIRGKGTWERIAGK